MAKTEKVPTRSEILEAGILALTNKSMREGKLYDDVAALPRDEQRTVMGVIRDAGRQGR